jgi:hypothetical protein
MMSGGNAHLAKIVRDNDLLMPGLEAILAAMVMTAWMAFESLAADLWVEAVNFCPKPLADRMVEKKPSETIKLSNLQNYEYNLQGKMGELFRDSKKVGFDSFNGIKSAFGDILEQTTGIFNNHKLLRPISELRNCFAHRGGIVDARAQPSVILITGLENITAGDAAKLTGPLVRVVVTEIVRCAVELFTFVDGWIDNNKLKFEALR